MGTQNGASPGYAQMNEGYAPILFNKCVDVFRKLIIRHIDPFEDGSFVSAIAPVSDQRGAFLENLAAQLRYTESPSVDLSEAIPLSQSVVSRVSAMPAEGLFGGDDYSPETISSPELAFSPLLQLYYPSPEQSEVTPKPRRIRNQYASPTIPAGRPGPNKYGRRGTRRCTQCRNWRQKAFPLAMEANLVRVCTH